MRKIIVNPNSGTGKSIKVAGELGQFFIEQGLPYQTYITSKKGDATEYVKQCEKEDIIYSVGGDGTLNEVVNGIGESGKRLCVIPSGSGNDFYKSLDNVKSGLIDLGKVNDTYFINSFSIGLDAEIGVNAELFKSKYIPRKLIYDLSIIYTLMHYEAKDVHINGVFSPSTMVTLTNGRYYGGGFQISPNAKINDNLLDYTQVGPLTKIETLKLLVKLLKSTHTEDPYVETTKVKNLTITSNIPLIACVDGELLKANEYKIAILDNALEIYEEPNLDIKKLIKK